MAEFAINGFVSEYIENGDWNKRGAGLSLAGLPVWGGYVPHIMTGTVMPFAEWLTFKTLEGQSVTVRTVDYFARLNFRTYAGIIKAVDGTQNSINMLGIRITVLLFLGTDPSPTTQGIP